VVGGGVVWWRKSGGVGAGPGALGGPCGVGGGGPRPPADTLPEKLREREQPSDRKPVSQIICEGSFAF